MSDSLFVPRFGPAAICRTAPVPVPVRAPLALAREPPRFVPATLRTAPIATGPLGYFPWTAVRRRAPPSIQSLHDFPGLPSTERTDDSRQTLATTLDRVAELEDELAKCRAEVEQLRSQAVDGQRASVFVSPEYVLAHLPPETTETRTFGGSFTCPICECDRTTLCVFGCGHWMCVGCTHKICRHAYAESGSLATCPACETEVVHVIRVFE